VRVINIYTSFKENGGAESVAISLADGLRESGVFSASLVGSFDDYEKISRKNKLQLKSRYYSKLSGLKFLFANDVIIISHHRLMTTLIILLSKMVFQKIKLIHVAHNEFDTLKHFSLFPKHVIAVSERVKINLKEYFKIKNSSVILNGIKAPATTSKRDFNPLSIKILLPGRITKVKQQIEVYNNLKNNIPKEIQILFAGDGPQLEELQVLVDKNPSFKCLGFVENMSSLYNDVDFVMLYSKNEGLPLSLIEALSFGKPIICNDVGGNMEILEPNKNGYLVRDFRNLIGVIEQLINLSQNDYKSMSQFCKRSFQQKFSYEMMIKNYLNFLKDEKLV